MELHDSNQELVGSQSHSQEEVQYSSNEEDILCNHCKRSATNGIRCIGMCVADNDY